MPLAALILVLIAALCHATWNLAAKQASSRGLPFIFLQSVFSVVLWLPVAVIAMIVDPVSLLGLLLGAGVSSMIHIGYNWVLQRGYMHGDISVVYPLARGTGPLLSVVFAIILFHERPSPLALVGAVIIVSGVLVIALSGPRRPRPSLTAVPGKRFGRIAVPTVGVVYGLLTGLTIATYTLWDAFTVNHLGVSALVFMVGCTLGESIVLFPAISHRCAEVRSASRDFRWQTLTVAVLSPLSYIFVLTALTMAPVALVAPLREVSVVFVSVAGWLLFSEPRPRARLVGAFTVLAGVVFIALF